MPALKSQRLINADPKEIVWTSGATESDNLAIKGAARFHKDKGKHLITVKTEHKAVLDSMRELEREGFEVTYMDVGKDGLLDLDALAKAMRPDTTLVSVMAVNNEIGVIQDIEKIGEMCRERGILFHVDATQAAGKIPPGYGKTQGGSDEPFRPQALRTEGNGCALCSPQTARSY